MNFNVHLTDAASDNVRAILRWIEERSPAGAETWYRRWIEILGTIAERANALAVAPESEFHSEPIRQIIFRTKQGRPYRALFVVRRSEVFILHVRGPGQDLMRPDDLITQSE